MKALKSKSKLQKPLCSVHKAVDLIGSKWTILILHQLCSDKRGFNELLKGIQDINPRALSARLKEMVDSKLITRTLHPDSRQVEYALTNKGASLKSIITQLGNWADTI
ncbi:MAG: transcriptional regulator, HxlR family [Candidatus Doudnabacteria bacterium]|nr:transcriptional regulator, HxlR family [Candidatus Doudnabacteria bacterium]